MANEKSLRTMETRKAYDQVSFLMGKGGRDLLRVLALRDGGHTTTTDILRRAVLDAAGLHAMPSADDLAELAAVETPADAETAIQKLQGKEEWSPADDKAPTLDDTSYRWDVRLNPDEWEVFLNISDQIEDALRMQNKVIVEQGMDAPGLDRIRIWMTGEELRNLRRVVANLKRYVLFTDTHTEEPNEE